METLRTEVIEDGAKRDRRGRRMLPPQRIEALVSEYRASGLTQEGPTNRVTVSRWWTPNDRTRIDETQETTAVPI